MQVTNRDSYSNCIYSGIVVNTNTDQDPDGKYRVQIYIPNLQYEYDNKYEEYMNSGDKTNSNLKNVFPWAKSLVKDLKEGNVVYVNYIGNDSNSYVILGLDANNPVNETSTSSNGNIDGLDVLSLCMPIIIHNEIGIQTNQWPNDIPDSKYTNINPYDNGGWSIGLIQWHHARAFDVLNYIASKDANWKTYWTDTSLDLYQDLSSSNTGKRNKYGASFHPTKGTPLYNGIQKMLSSDSGKSAQREYAQQDTKTAIDDLQNNYGITNPALLIYLADIMNQYGNGISSKTKASQIAKTNEDTMTQLDNFVTYWKRVTKNAYSTRRDTTYAYIKQLNDAGKLTTSTLTDISNGGVAGSGTYCMPFKGTFKITAQWGKRGYANGYTGYSSGSAHSGIDFGCPAGTPLVSCTNGTVEKTARLILSYGTHVQIRADDGNLIIYAHMTNFIVNKGDKVTKGQLIGYSGNTGHSFGAHLHYEIRPRVGGDNSANMWGSTNPAPFLGISGHTNDTVQGA